MKPKSPFRSTVVRAVLTFAVGFVAWNLHSVTSLTFGWQIPQSPKQDVQLHQQLEAKNSQREFQTDVQEVEKTYILPQQQQDFFQNQSDNQAHQPEELQQTKLADELRQEEMQQTQEALHEVNDQEAVREYNEPDIEKKDTQEDQQAEEEDVQNEQTSQSPKADNDTSFFERLYAKQTVPQLQAPGPAPIDSEEGPFNPFTRHDVFAAFTSIKPKFKRKPGWRATCPGSEILPKPSELGSFIAHIKSLQTPTFSPEALRLDTCTRDVSFPPGVFRGWERIQHDIDRVQTLFRDCKVVVVTAIFGAQDDLSMPLNVSPSSAELICFVAILDPITAGTYDPDAGSGKKLAGIGKVGIWNTVVLQGYPFQDPRMNGKVPKILIQWLFPYAHYSIWLDGKLQLQVDPLAFISHTLLQNSALFAASEHPVRESILQEALKLKELFFTIMSVNKSYNKLRVGMIEAQIKEYKSKGFELKTGLNDGGLLIQKHHPLTRSMGCNWFNEVLKLPHGRDQMSLKYSAFKSDVLKKFHSFPKCGFVVAVREIGHKIRTGVTTPS